MSNIACHLQKNQDELPINSRQKSRPSLEATHQSSAIQNSYHGLLMAAFLSSAAISCAKPTSSPSSFPQTTVVQSTSEQEPEICETLPVQKYNGIEVEKDQMQVVKLQVCPGYTYTACTDRIQNNPDLYGGKKPPTLTSFEKSSTDDLMTKLNENDQPILDQQGNPVQIPRPDCISFSTDSKDYYLGVYGAAENSKANVWVSAFNPHQIPKEFQKSLQWFSDSCVQLTDETYGPMNAPWGNDVFRPTFNGYPNYLHGGYDFACKPNTSVEAMCDGVIVDSNEAGGDWGYHTVLECEKDGAHISIAFIHLQKESILPIGTQVKTGQEIGKVYNLKVQGEIPHVHITACQKKHADCELAGFQPERGAARNIEWWGATRYWFNITNPSLYQKPPQEFHDLLPKSPGTREENSPQRFVIPDKK